MGEPRLNKFHRDLIKRVEKAGSSGKLKKDSDTELKKMHEGYAAADHSEEAIENYKKRLES